jgi:hypothetical protein
MKLRRNWEKCYTGNFTSIKEVLVQNGKKVDTDVRFAVVSKQNGQKFGNGTNGELHFSMK